MEINLKGISSGMATARSSKIHHQTLPFLRPGTVFSSILASFSTRLSCWCVLEDLGYHGQYNSKAEKDILSNFHPILTQKFFDWSFAGLVPTLGLITGAKDIDWLAFVSQMPIPVVGGRVLWKIVSPKSQTEGTQSWQGNKQHHTPSILRSFYPQPSKYSPISLPSCVSWVLV